ncbi:hypothetical protein Q9966_010701 [Columba livia]|nr:hypothetical protein Q9966_010701 [Columba livia]
MQPVLLKTTSYLKITIPSEAAGEQNRSQDEMPDSQKSYNRNYPTDRRQDKEASHETQPCFWLSGLSGPIQQDSELPTESKTSTLISSEIHKLTSEYHTKTLIVNPDIGPTVLSQYGHRDGQDGLGDAKNKVPPWERHFKPYGASVPLYGHLVRNSNICHIEQIGEITHVSEPGGENTDGLCPAEFLVQNVLYTGNAFFLLASAYLANWLQISRILVISTCYTVFIDACSLRGEVFIRLVLIRPHKCRLDALVDLQGYVKDSSALWVNTVSIQDSVSANA